MVRTKVLRAMSANAGVARGRGVRADGGVGGNPAVASTTRSRLRCAVYTRKSSEEGLDQEFNSLDAQREACLAFIASQTGLGWKPVRDQYDDGGISGGTMQRPALQRLLQDIRDQKIDVVVVYKIDRLTRSLMDFARMVEVFDASGVSFVSVTQQFNTTNSMGRLTLNVLLSFAQFEREVTAERIRDKIAASKKKGMWMGGRVSLGYRAVDRKLVVDEEVAPKVRHLFCRYLELESVTALARDIGNVHDLRDNTASPRPGRMSRGQLYHLLSNPIYIGKIRHRDQIHDGEHQGIIEQALFDEVQASLAEKSSQRRNPSNRPDVHLLTGMVFDETGDRLSPTHAYNHGKRYRYYISHRLKTACGNRSDGWRLAASNLEDIVLRQARELLLDRKLLSEWVEEHASAQHIESFLKKNEAMAAELQPVAISARPKQILRTIFQKITVSMDAICFVVRKQALVDRFVSARDASQEEEGLPEIEFPVQEEIIAIDRKIAIKRRGVEARIIIEGDTGREPEPALVALVARAHYFRSRLCDGSVSSIAELAREVSVHRADISRILPLAFLSPAIIDAILAGSQPADLTARTLSRLVDIPPCWKDQAKVLGMQTI